ncbi:AfsR/SARP family transcriptional regulator [Amycolatopsis magusensis]|uniref:AfsR/SARP family transcriptional regulator n=1 Tax=Amycolatopsis magusensis TaxID=882444 RepID=UPI0024A82130|nr:AfsR/SARP family transcriptional regulator [Amycolatopsis magusensis]MDI5975006.1 BTAD domain-containing putative transcriptional regulator [Amycolatopsis magusensis]
MRFQLLGPVEVRDDANRVVELSACKMRTVLAVLLLARNRVVSDGHIAEMLWGDQPPATAAAQIQTYVSRLRQRLGPGVPISRQLPGYLLQIEPGRLDLAEFERLAARGREEAESGRWIEAAASLREALARWRMPCLTGVTEPLSAARRPALEEARMSVLEDRIEADLALGRPAELVPELAGLVTAHPLRERLRGQLMQALAGSGRQADALASYQSYRHLLAEELGIGPGPELRDLHQHILLAHPVPETPAEAQPRLGAWLPPDLADFTGRETELGRILDLLRPADTQLGRRVGCVVAGMAGVGKSALAMHAAHRLREEYPDGQVYVEAGERSSFELLGDLLAALEGGVSGVPDGLDERVRRYRAVLVDRRVLVVLDNVADEQQIRPLLPDTPRCGALVTSRTRLAAIEGVPVVDLGVLDTEPAVRFLEKVIGAARVEAEAGVARDIVRYCGGLPLAVRIAGGRLVAKPHWRLAVLAERLRLPDRRLDELRQADLEVRGAIERTLLGVDEESRSAFRVLGGIDAPGFSVDTAASALGVPVASAHDLVENLLDARLLEVNCSPDGQAVRYHFHELVRVVARDAIPLIPAARVATG